MDSPKSAKKLKVDYGFCGRLLAAIKGTEDLSLRFPQTEFDPTRPPSDEEHAVFHDGYLVSVRFAVGLTRKVLLGLGEASVRSSLPAVPYEDVYGDMVGKFGKESKSGSDKLQNAFGAIITHRRAIWVYHDIYVAAIAELDSSEDTPVILVQLASRDELARETEQAAKNRKSTIE